MFYRTSFDNNEVDISDFIQKSFNHKKIPDPDSTPRCISKGKKDAIVQKLCPLMQSNRRQLRKHFPVTSVKDLKIDEDDSHKED